jgi:hypothetical protein
VRHLTYNEGPTLSDAVLDLATLMGVAESNDDPDDNRPRIPEDRATRDRLIRALNSGLRDMALANIGWSWMTPTIKVNFNTTADSENIDNDIARRQVPGFCDSGFIESPMVIEASTLTPRVVSIATVAEIEAQRAADPGKAGFPIWVALAPVTRRNSGDATTMSMVVFPKPDRAFTVVARVRLTTRLRFTSLGESFPCGAEHMETLKWAAAYKLQVESPLSTGPSVENARAEYLRLLGASINLDKQMQPANLGSIPVHDPVRVVDPWVEPNPTGPRVHLGGGIYAP